MTAALVLCAFILALIELIRQRGQSLLGCAVLVLSIALGALSMLTSVPR